jgi:hypothetical protein
MPWEFDRLTPTDLQDLLRGARERRREPWRVAAQLAAWLLQPYSKRRLTARKLLSFPPEPVDDER